MPSRENLDKYIQETYGVTAEFPWLQYPGFAVYRHNNNQKWFAVVMNLSRSKFGLPDDKTVDAVNLKCDPIMTGSLHKENGIYPAYHIRKLDRRSRFYSCTGSLPADSVSQRWH